MRMDEQGKDYQTETYPTPSKANDQDFYFIVSRERRDIFPPSTSTDTVIDASDPEIISIAEVTMTKPEDTSNITLQPPSFAYTDSASNLHGPPIAASSKYTGTDISLGRNNADDLLAFSGAQSLQLQEFLNDVTEITIIDEQGRPSKVTIPSTMGPIEGGDTELLTTLPLLPTKAQDHVLFKTTIPLPPSRTEPQSTAFCPHLTETIVTPAEAATVQTHPLTETSNTQVGEGGLLLVFTEISDTQDEGGVVIPPPETSDTQSEGGMVINPPETSDTQSESGMVINPPETSDSQNECGMAIHPPETSDTQSEGGMVINPPETSDSQNECGMAIHPPETSDTQSKDGMVIQPAETSDTQSEGRMAIHPHETSDTQREGGMVVHPPETSDTQSEGGMVIHPPETSDTQSEDVMVIQPAETSDTQSEGRMAIHPHETSDTQREGGMVVHPPETSDTQSEGGVVIHPTETSDTQSEGRIAIHPHETSDTQREGGMVVHPPETFDTQSEGGMVINRPETSDIQGGGGVMIHQPETIGIHGVDEMLMHLDETNETQKDAATMHTDKLTTTIDTQIEATHVQTTVQPVASLQSLPSTSPVCPGPRTRAPYKRSRYGTRNVENKRARRSRTRCYFCKNVYSKNRDNLTHGRWVGCENYEVCGSWAHAVKCLGWEESDVDTDKTFTCPSCSE